MIKLGGLVDLRPQWLGEAEDDKYVSIGFGRYKQKGKEDDDNAPTFKKDDSGKYVPTGGKAAKGGDSSAKKDKPKVNIFDKPKKDKVAKGSDSSAEKIDNAYDAKDFEPIVSSLKGKIDDQEYEEISDEMKALEVMQDEIEDLEDNGENTYNEKIELDFAVEDLQDRIKQSLLPKDKDGGGGDGSGKTSFAQKLDDLTKPKEFKDANENEQRRIIINNLQTHVTNTNPDNITLIQLKGTVILKLIELGLAENKEEADRYLSEIVATKKQTENNNNEIPPNFTGTRDGIIYQDGKPMYDLENLPTG